MNFEVFLGLVILVVSVTWCSATPAADVQELYNAVAPLQQTVKESASEHEPVVITTQFHSQDELGQYTYGYASSDGTAKVEIKDHEGIVAGKYAYIDPNGAPVEVYYTADKDGFHPVSNNLPQAPAVPELPEDLRLAYEEANNRLAAAYAAAAKQYAAEAEETGGGEGGGADAYAEEPVQETILVPVILSKAPPHQPKSKKRSKGHKKHPKRHAIYSDGHYGYYVW